MARAVFATIAAGFLLVGPAAAENFVKPGDTITLPTPIKNADDEGNPGGDTISSMQLIVTGDTACVTNAVASAAQSLAPGEAKTFTPSFVVGPALDGQTCNVTLHMVSSDVGIDPDPDDPAGDTLVRFTVDRTPPHLTIGFAACPAYDRTFKGGLDIGLLGRDTSPGAQTSPTRPGVLARIFPHRSLGRERENNCWRSISPLPGFVKTCFDRPQNS